MSKFSWHYWSVFGSPDGDWLKNTRITLYLAGWNAPTASRLIQQVFLSSCSQMAGIAELIRRKKLARLVDLKVVELWVDIWRDLPHTSLILLTGCVNLATKAWHLWRYIRGGSIYYVRTRGGHWREEKVREMRRFHLPMKMWTRWLGGGKKFKQIWKLPQPLLTPQPAVNNSARPWNRVSFLRDIQGEAKYGQSCNFMPSRLNPLKFGHLVPFCGNLCTFLPSQRRRFIRAKARFSIFNWGITKYILSFSREAIHCSIITYFKWSGTGT